MTSVSIIVHEQKDSILIRMKSISRSWKCPKCHCITEKYHGTYNRKVQDLPIPEKSVWLEICAHEYECMNVNCEVITVAETFHGLMKRMHSLMVMVLVSHLVFLQKEVVARSV